MANNDDAGGDRLTSLVDSLFDARPADRIAFAALLLDGAPAFISSGKRMWRLGTFRATAGGDDAWAELCVSEDDVSVPIPHVMKRTAGATPLPSLRGSTAAVLRTLHVATVRQQQFATRRLSAFMRDIGEAVWHAPPSREMLRERVEALRRLPVTTGHDAMWGALTDQEPACDLYDAIDMAVDNAPFLTCAVTATRAPPGAAMIAVPFGNITCPLCRDRVSRETTHGMQFMMVGPMRRALESGRACLAHGCEGSGRPSIVNISALLVHAPGEEEEEQDVAALSALLSHE